MKNYYRRKKKNEDKIGKNVLLCGNRTGRIINVCGDRFKVYVFGNGGIHVFNKNEVKLFNN